MTIENYYANTKKQPLDQHLFAVGFLSYRFLQRFGLQESGDQLAKVAFVAGCLHDIGKIDPLFQNWIIEKTKKRIIDEIPEEGQHIDKKSGKGWFETHPRHNEISLLLYHLLNDETYKKISNKNSIKHALYWHHAKPIRKPESEFEDMEGIYKRLKNNLDNADFEPLFNVFEQIIKQINKLTEEYSDSGFMLDGFLAFANEDSIYDLSTTPLPEYKRYTNANEHLGDYLANVKENARNNLIRSVVVTADRLVSNYSSEDLRRYIEEKTLYQLLEQALIQEQGLNLAIEACLDGFEQRYPDSERNRQQSIAANKLAEEEVAVGVLNGAAGCGKTKIALEWALKTGVKKIIWICPRVQVCQGLFNDLTSKAYLPDAKIEINTGEFKLIHQSGSTVETVEGMSFSGDIVITTIDQITNAIITHRHVDSLVAYMDSHVVFDEYHEYISMPAFNLLFAELVMCKKFQGNYAKALLVSATPNYCFVEELLEINPQDIIGIESFNQSSYQIRFVPFDETKQDENNPLFQLQPSNTFVISNTAINAQLSFIANQTNENAILLHSKFKKSDKQDLFNQVFDNFKENGSHQYDLLRSGPIVQASLNISCDKMVTEFTHAENWLQRLGRLDRFGKNITVNEYVTAIPENLVTTGKQVSSCAKFLSSLNSLKSAKTWHQFLQSKINDEPVTINQIYQLYKDFYKPDSYYRTAIEEDLKKALKESVVVINKKLHDPVSIPPKTTVKDGAVKIKKHSLRGDNRFVQMAKWNIGNGNTEFPNEYAYSETDIKEANKASLIYSVEAICGYRDSEQDLLDFMAKKHHNIKNDEKYGVKSTTKFKDKIYLNKSRDTETPIYLSYTPEDLKKVESQPHSYAVYYVIGRNQSIGAFARNRLELEEE